MADPARKVFGTRLATLGAATAVSFAEIGGMAAALARRHSEELGAAIKIGDTKKIEDLLETIMGMVRQVFSGNTLAAAMLSAATEEVVQEMDQAFRDQILDRITTYNWVGNRFNPFALILDLFSMVIQEVLTRIGISVKDNLTPNELDSRARGVLRIALGGEPAEWMVKQTVEYIQKYSLVAHTDLDDEGLAAIVQEYVDRNPSNRQQPSQGGSNRPPSGGGDQPVQVDSCYGKDADWREGIIEATKKFVRESGDKLGLTDHEYDVIYNEYGVIDSDIVVEWIAQAIVEHVDCGDQESFPWAFIEDPVTAFYLFMSEYRWLLMEF